MRIRTLVRLIVIVLVLIAWWAGLTAATAWASQASTPGFAAAIVYLLVLTVLGLNVIKFTLKGLLKP
jgi:hypothetical protein